MSEQLIRRFAGGDARVCRNVAVTLLEMVMELKKEHGTVLCPPNSRCMGGDDGETCMACWLLTAAQRIK